MPCIVICALFGCYFSNRSGMADLVHNRYYCIQRIQKAVLFLIQEIEKTEKSWDTLISQHVLSSSFEHPIVNTMIQSLIYKHDSSAVMDLWDLFSSYHFIEDIRFLDETIRAVALIAVGLTVELTHQRVIRFGDRLIDIDDFYIDDLSSDQLCALIKVCSLQMQHQDILFIPLFDKTQSQDSINVLVHVDTIAERFYYVHRYEKAIALLHNFYMHLQALKDFDVAVIVDEITALDYHHPFVISCVQKMRETRSVAPLFFVCNQLKEYECIGQEEFITDFTQLIFVCYYTIYSYFVIKKPRLTNEQQSVMEKISLVYEKIEKLPVEEILSVIDILVHDLPILMDQCQLYSSVSWSGWFKQYWWAPALMGVNVFLRIVKKLFGKPNPHNYPSYTQSNNALFSLE